ncbi:MAG: DNA-directed RNA polymerase subunit beta, partial [Clostridia bacterium]|nr:DNA-directed RNA polymerase subunit beta [Clostridia bacterium]
MVNVKEQRLGKNVRMSFSKTKNTIDLPNLVEIQTQSFKWLLEKGLDEVLHEVSPITDFSGNLSIEFLSYSLDSKPKYSVEECKDREANYAAPLKVNVRLTNKQTGEVKQTDIFMGEFPIMTETGTFVINGAERVIVSQIVRSPGMYYASAFDKSGKKTYTAQVIPYRGAWLEYEIDINGVSYVRIDKVRKVPVTLLIRALGVEPVGSVVKGKPTEYRSTIETKEDVYKIFGEEEKLITTFEKDECEELSARSREAVGIEALKEIYKKLRPGEPPLVESAHTLLSNCFFDQRRYDIAPVGRYKFDKKLALSGRIVGHKLASDVVSPLTGEVLYEAGTLISAEAAAAMERAAVNEVDLLVDDKKVRVISNNTIDPQYIIGTDLTDCGIREKVSTPVLVAIAEECGGDMDAIKEKCRERIAELCPKHITKDDIFASINYLFNLTHGVGCVDDIDHLGNRR